MCPTFGTHWLARTHTHTYTLTHTHTHPSRIHTHTRTLTHSSEMIDGKAGDTRQQTRSTGRLLSNKGVGVGWPAKTARSAFVRPLTSVFTVRLNVPSERLAGLAGWLAGWLVVCLRTVWECARGSPNLQQDLAAPVFRSLSLSISLFLSQKYTPNPSQ